MDTCTRSLKRPRLSDQTVLDTCSADADDRSAQTLATELAAAGDVLGLLLLESRLHAVLAQPDADCVKVVGFLRRESTCTRLVQVLLLDDLAASTSDPERGSADTPGGQPMKKTSLGASDAGRAAFAASCVLGGGIPEVAATLATSDAVWRALITALRRQHDSSPPVQGTLPASMLERMCRSFFLRAGSKAREGFVVMAKRHGLLQVVLDSGLQSSQLLSLLPLIYRHDHSSKRYAYWASLELGMRLTSQVLAASSPEPAGYTAPAPLLVEHEHACEALVAVCEWSAGDRSRPAGMPMTATSSTDARQWGLSLLAELAERCGVAGLDCTKSDSTIGGRLVEVAANDCDLSQRSRLLGVRSLTAVLSLSSSLRQPASSQSHAAIALATSVATAIPRIAATLEQLATSAMETEDRCLDVVGAGTSLCRCSTDILIQAVRCIGAAADMVASCACGRPGPDHDDSQGDEAIEPLRAALVRAHVPTLLMHLLLGAVGGTLSAPHIVEALKHIWATPIVRDELFAADNCNWWTQWCLPMLDRARLHTAAAAASTPAHAADSGAGSDVQPCFGHIVTVSCLCDENEIAITTEVIRHLTLQASSCSEGNLSVDSTDTREQNDSPECPSGSGSEKTDGRIAMWCQHMKLVSAARAAQAATDLRLAQLKRRLKQQRHDAQQQKHQQGGEMDDVAGCALAVGGAQRSFVGVSAKRMPIAD